MGYIAKYWLSNVMCLITSARNNGHVRVNCGVKATGRQTNKLTDIEAEINQRDGSIYRQTSSLVRAVSSFSIWYVLLHLLIDALVAG